jgi:hypothetical protein
MNVKTRTIEVDAKTADVLKARAAARGLSVSELISDFAFNQEVLPTDIGRLQELGESPWSAEALARDAERLAEFQRTRAGVPWDEVKAWMQSWGTPQELPPPKSRKL